MDYKKMVDLNQQFAKVWKTGTKIVGVGEHKPDDFLEMNAAAITDLLVRAEAEEAKANDAERVALGMAANYFRVNEVAKKILDYSRSDDTPDGMKDDLHEAAIMLFGVDEAQRKAEQAMERAEKAEDRAEKAEKERDAAIKRLRETCWCAGCEHFKGLDGCQLGSGEECSPENDRYEFAVKEE